jgi:phosphonopyruvate decarboxylase
MINAKEFYQEFKNNNLDFFTGVPDSLLGPLCSFLYNNCNEKEHLIAANEGTACANAIGYHMATNKIPVVYMQNSGLGNAYNPLVSLCNEKILSIPMLLLIGWRAEIKPDNQQQQDEPQHQQQGLITTTTLESMEIEFDILDQNSNYQDIIKKTVNKINSSQAPKALLVRKNTFSPCSLERNQENIDLSREQAIKIISKNLQDNIPIIATTGKSSRELFEVRENNKQDHQRDFLTVGGMGHASQIALGIAMFKPKNKVCCIDGDGAFLMHMGGAGKLAQCPNFIHVLIVNQSHDSVGGLPTSQESINFKQLAQACGYKHIAELANAQKLEQTVQEYSKTTGSSIIIVQTNRKSRKDLGRPSISPINNKIQFMNFLKNISGKKND